jgi:hypothetical protein
MIAGYNTYVAKMKSGMVVLNLLQMLAQQYT